MGGVAAFEGANCEGAIRRLERAAQELQVVLVVDRPAIEAWARGLGEGAAVWSPDVAARAEEEERARREAAERARRETEARAVREAEEHAPVALVDLTAAETVAPPPSPPVVDLTDDHANAAQDDWWVPIVARPGTSRAARPVGEDLGQRRRRAEQIAADSTGSTTCDVHRNLETALHCSRCGLPFCDQCLALLGEPPALHCVDCALELSGARTDRSARGA